MISNKNGFRMKYFYFFFFQYNKKIENNFFYSKILAFFYKFIFIKSENFQ